MSEGLKFVLAGFCLAAVIFLLAPDISLLRALGVIVCLCVFAVLVSGRG